VLAMRLTTKSAPQAQYSRRRLLPQRAQVSAGGFWSWFSSGLLRRGFFVPRCATVLVVVALCCLAGAMTVGCEGGARVHLYTC
jgi:hypothetical protein